MKYNFRKIESVDFKAVTKLIFEYYQEDKTDKPISSEKIQRTLTELSEHSDKGTVLVLEVEKEIMGYCILVNFWSNEYGGNVLFIDEIYLAIDFRGQGIATNFIRFLAKKKI